MLQRLGLPHGQALSSIELPVDELLAKLKSDRWEERIVAVRALGKLETAVPIDTFVSTLHDEDATVRAVTVHVLGNMGRRAPLHWLVEALQDADWHVREVAILALGKQGQRVPDEVVMTALHDTDGSVREAARFALHSRTEKTVYGRLWEEKSMQREQQDSALSNGKYHASEKVPQDGWSGTFIEYSGNSHASQNVREQAQAYAAQEYAPNSHLQREAPSYDYAEAGAVPARGEKITSYRIHGKSHKGWWAAIIVTAILFLGLGRLSTLVVQQTDSRPVSKGDVTVDRTVVVYVPFKDATYAPIMQKELSTLFHLTPQQIMEQLKSRGDLSRVAGAQGVNSSQLKESELKVTTQVVTNARDSGHITQQEADKLMQQLQNDPVFLDKATMMLFNDAV